MLIQLLIAAIVIGAILYVLQMVPMDGRLKSIVTVVAIVIFAIYALKLLAPMAGFN